jgi:hypothetical protein
LLKELGSAAGTVDADLKRVLTDNQASIDKMSNSWDRLKKSVGETIAPRLRVSWIPFRVVWTVRRQSMRAWKRRQGKGLVGSHRLGPTSSEAEKDSMAWVGGYRTKEQRNLISAYGAYGKMRSEAPAYRMPRETLPDVGPVVTTRDGQVIPAAAASQAGAAVPLPIDKPNQTDMAIARQDAERWALNNDLRREGIGSTRGSAPMAAVSSDGISARPGRAFPICRFFSPSLNRPARNPLRPGKGRR